MEKKQFRLGGGRRGDGGRNHFKNAGFIALLILFGLVIYAAVNQPSHQLKSVPFSQVVSDANNGKIKQIEVKGDELDVTPVGQSSATEKSFKEPGSSIYEQGLKQGKVTLLNKPSSDNNSLWVGLISSVLPVVIIAVIL